MATIDDGATAQPIGLFVLRFDLSSDLQCQLDSGGCHLLGDQLADRLVDGRAGNRLAVRFSETVARAVADIPRLLFPAPRRISDAAMSAASSTHCAPLQQGHPLTRWRRSSKFVPSTVALEDFEVLLELLPGDVTGMSVRDAGEPVVAVPLSQDLFAIGGSPIMPPAIGIGARITRVVQGADRG